MSTEDNPAGNPVLHEGSHGLGALASYMEHVTWLSKLLKVMLKGSERSVERLEYFMLQPMLLTITPVLDD